MLLNLSARPEESRELIESEIGVDFDLQKRKQLNGVNSGILMINSASMEIQNLLILNEGINTCNIEIKKDGILIRFQVNMESFALVIPFYKLKFNKGQAEQYTFHRDQYFINIQADRPANHEFIRKIRTIKAEHWSSNTFPG